MLVGENPWPPMPPKKKGRGSKREKTSLWEKHVGSQRGGKNWRALLSNHVTRIGKLPAAENLPSLGCERGRHKCWKIFVRENLALQVKLSGNVGKPP